MTKMKNEKGITLVALIITIIIILILAIIAIHQITNGGIITEAEDARQQYISAENTEEIDLQNSVDFIREVAQGVQNGSGTESPDSLVAKFKAGELGVGDYINYSPSTVSTAYNPDNGAAGSQTGYATAQSISQESLNWRILGYDATHNRILLISSTPTTQGISLYGHVGYNNAESILNDTCATLYSNSTLGATARCITMNDIDQYLGGSAYDKTSFRPISGGGPWRRYCRILWLYKKFY